jgi:uncharacterized protein (DUF1778 family)
MGSQATPPKQQSLPGRIARREERLEARLTAEQKTLLQRAADLQGRSLSDFVVASAHDAALKTIQDLQAIQLGEADSRAFAEALLHPRQPNAVLHAAAKRYRESAGG